MGQHRWRSSLLLVLINLLPLGGVLFLDWDLAALIVLYWSENLIIGFYNLVKMFSALGKAAAFPAAFFLLHYGGFCAIHGLFLQSLLLEGSSNNMQDLSWPLFLIFLELLLSVVQSIFALAPAAWIIAFVGLLISHGYSFVQNFLLGGERETATVASLMSQPYKRIFVLHIAIIAGGVGIMALGEPLLMLVTLVLAKTAIDLTLHRREHDRGHRSDGAQRPGPEQGAY